MTLFHIPYTTFYYSAIVNIVLFLSYLTLNNIWVRGHSRSFKLVPFESLSTVTVFFDAASRRIVTMAVSCISSEIKRHWSKIVIFSYPHAFDSPVRGSPSEYCHPVWYGIE